MMETHFQIDIRNTVMIVLALLLCMVIINTANQGSTLLLVEELLALAVLWFRIQLDRDGVICAALAIAIMVISVLYSDYASVVKGVHFFLPCAIGFTMYRTYEDPFRFLRGVVWCVFFGGVLFICLELLYNRGVVFEYNRLLLNIWTGGFISVTLVGLISSFSIGFSFYLLFFQKSKLRILCGAAGIILVVVLNFRTATRTPFFIIALTLAAALILCCRMHRGDLVYYAVMMIAGLLIVLALEFDWFDIRETFDSTKLGHRFIDSDSESRIKIAWMHLREMPRGLFGGSRIYELTGWRAHNLIQDCMDMYGLIPALLELFVLLSSAGNLIWLFRRADAREEAAILFFTSFPIFVQLMLEPIHIGYPILFWVYLLLHGITNAFRADEALAKVGAVA